MRRALGEAHTVSVKGLFPGFRQAAVLVPLLETERGLELLLTVRSAHLPSHGGQIAFPGGGLEADESVTEAAIRETYEETGLEVLPEHVLGRLSEQPSPANYLVTPIVARLEWPQALRVNAGEVHEVFFVPLSALLELTPQTETRVLLGRERTLYSFLHASGQREYRIWGLTGSILAELLELMRAL